MPSKTYFNLSLEKQKQLMKAAKKEFSEYSFHEASINRIIKEASIPRGSFYAYFNDKEDLYNYMLLSHREKMKQDFIQFLKEKDGHLFEAQTLFFKHIVTYTAKHDKKFFRNMFSNLNYKRVQGVWKKEVHKCSEKINIQEFLPYIDKNLLQVEKDNDVLMMLEILFMVMIKHLVMLHTSDIKADEIFQIWDRHLTLLQQGFLKEKEDLC